MIAVDSGGVIIARGIRQKRARLILCALALAGEAGTAGAAPLDFLFGAPPPPGNRTYRSRHRTPRVVQPAAPVPEAAEVPIPPRRPHFASDPPPAASREAPKPAVAAQAPAPTAKTPEPAAKAPEVSAKPPETEAAKSADAAPPAASGPPTPPLPPPKPAELETPRGQAAKPLEPAAPAAAPSAAVPAQPQEIGKPGPDRPEQGKSEPPKSAPPVAPSGATTAFTPRSPEDDPQCPSRLAASKVDVAPTAIGPQPDERCTVVQPVRLAGITLADGDKVAFPEHPTIACTTADAFSSYVRDLLVPLAKGTFGATVTAVWTGPGLECRSRDHVFGAKLSAHGQGLAIDIAQLKLADGRMIEVGTPTTDAETGFETAARAGACGYFHTVLGPGSDSYHRTHWHFDLEVRGSHGDSKYCK